MIKVNEFIGTDHKSRDDDKKKKTLKYCIINKSGFPIQFNFRDNKFYRFDHELFIVPRDIIEKDIYNAEDDKGFNLNVRINPTILYQVVKKFHSETEFFQ